MKTLLIGLVTFISLTASAAIDFCVERGNTKIADILSYEIIDSYNGEELPGLKRGEETFLFKIQPHVSNTSGPYYTIIQDGRYFGFRDIYLATQDENKIQLLISAIQNNQLVCHTGPDYQTVHPDYQIDDEYRLKLSVFDEGNLREGLDSGYQLIKIPSHIELFNQCPNSRLYSWGTDSSVVMTEELYQLLFTPDFLNFLWETNKPLYRTIIMGNRIQSICLPM